MPLNSTHWSFKESLYCSVLQADRGCDGLQVDVKITAPGIGRYGTNSCHKVTIYKMTAESRFIFEIKIVLRGHKSLCSSTLYRIYWRVSVKVFTSSPSRWLNEKPLICSNTHTIHKRPSALIHNLSLWSANSGCTLKSRPSCLQQSGWKQSIQIKKQQHINDLAPK